MTKKAHNRLDIKGMRFGRLVVIRHSGTRAGASHKDKKSAWECMCDCGNSVIVNGSSLTTGNTKSCGCLKSDSQRREHWKHGKNGSRVYRVWQAMLNRCRNKNSTGYKNYGGRGVSVCERWHEFKNFLSDMGEPENNQSIDRIDVNGNYEPENCRWPPDKSNQKIKEITGL